MDQYSNTILHLPDYQVTSEATIEERQTEQGTVMVQTIHGMVTTKIPDSCQHCGGRLHANQHLRVTLQHLVIGDWKIVLDVGYQQLLCTECHKTTRQDIPFKQRGHFITTCFHLQIEGLLRRSDMTVKGLACALLTNRKLVREVDKALLGDRYGDMLPTHPSAHICVDEFSLHKGHRYATVVLDWETGEILFLEEREQRATAAALLPEGWQAMDAAGEVGLHGHERPVLQGRREHISPHCDSLRRLPHNQELQRPYHHRTQETGAEPAPGAHQQKQGEGHTLQEGHEGCRCSRKGGPGAGDCRTEAVSQGSGEEIHGAEGQPLRAHQQQGGPAEEG